MISPLLANIYLHYALDLWVDNCRKPPRGEVIIIRYCDDFVIGCQYQNDAEQLLKDLQRRLAKFGLELHEGKTRLIEFGRFAEANRRKRGAGKPETFDFLGFTHICSKTRKDGRFTIGRKTIAKRLWNKMNVAAHGQGKAPIPQPATLSGVYEIVRKNLYKYYNISILSLNFL